MAIDLSKYGMHWSLDKSMATAMPANYEAMTHKVAAPAVYSPGSKITFRFAGATTNVYTIDKYLGGGTYGKVYDCVRERDGAALVIKVAADASLRDLVKESLIQILIVDATRDKSHPEIGLVGPYAPELHEIGFDRVENTGFIVSQKMNNTVGDLLTANAADDRALNSLVNRVMVQTSTILSELYSMFKFNHRDFKTDNCMYIRGADKNIIVKLIDFGFSYIEWGKLKISCRDFYERTLPARDMTQFMYETLKHHSFLPSGTKAVLRDLLTFKLPSGVTCKMYEGCDRVHSWRNTYDFLNSPTVTNPNGAADVVKRVYERILQKADYKPALAWAPGMNGLFVAVPAVPFKVPVGKIYNPDTGKYVDANGPLGKMLLRQIDEAKTADRAAVAAGLGVKLCPEDYNPKTRRCVKACAPGKVRNASTFKCVAPRRSTAKAKAAVVKKAKEAKAKAAEVKAKEVKALAAKKKAEKAVKAVKAVAVKAVKAVKISSKEQRIKQGLMPCLDRLKPDYNPKTKRCVKPCPDDKYRNRITFKCEKLPDSF